MHARSSSVVARGIHISINSPIRNPIQGTYDCPLRAVLRVDVKKLRDMTRTKNTRFGAPLIFSESPRNSKNGKRQAAGEWVPDGSYLGAASSSTVIVHPFGTQPRPHYHKREHIQNHAETSLRPVYGYDHRACHHDAGLDRHIVYRMVSSS